MMINRRESFSTFFLYTILVSILSSFFLMKSSLFYEFDTLIEGKPDLIIQKMEGGKAVNTPLEWSDEILGVDGVGNVYPRLFGTYFFEPARAFFTLVGFSLLEESYDHELQSIIDGTDFKTFQKDGGLYLGEGVKKILRDHFYSEKFSFFYGNGQKETLLILGTFSKKSSIETNDLILLRSEKIRKILNISDEDATDLVAIIPNPSEKSIVALKIREIFPNSRILDLSDINLAMKRNYDIFGGTFFALFLLPLLAFFILFYTKSTSLTEKGIKHVAILRALGWEIPLVMSWHLFSSFFISSFSFMVGVLLSYFYVFLFNAPGLNKLFLGYGNLSTNLPFSAVVPVETLFYLFLVTVIPYTLASIIPIYRSSISHPLEVIR